MGTRVHHLMVFFSSLSGTCMPNYHANRVVISKPWEWKDCEHSGNCLLLLEGKKIHFIFFVVKRAKCQVRWSTVRPWHRTFLPMVYFTNMLTRRFYACISQKRKRVEKTSLCIFALSGSASIEKLLFKHLWNWPLVT